MKKSLKFIFIIVITVLMLLSIAYVIGYSKLKKEYLNIYNSCLEKIPETQQLILNNPNSYSQAQECLNDGGCYIGCGSVCSPSKSSEYTFSESLFSLSSFIGCTKQCASLCLYP